MSNELKKNMNYNWLLPLLIIIVHAVFYFTSIIPNIFPDSGTYINFFDSDMGFNGRTPVYPIFLKLNRILFGEEIFLNLVVLEQEVISLISIYFLWKTLRLILSSEKIANFLIFLYGTSLAIVGWNFDILTESLAISGCVFYLYYMVHFLKNKADIDGVKVTIILIILTFLRPTYLLFVAVTFSFILLESFVSKRIYKKTYISMIVAMIILVLYSTWFYSEKGVFSISDPLSKNLLYVSMERGYYRNLDDIEIVNKVDEALDANGGMNWNAMMTISNFYGDKESQELAKESIIRSFPQYIKDEIHLAYGVCTMNFGSYQNEREGITLIQRELRTIIYCLVDVWKPIHVVCVAISSFWLFIKNLFKKKLDWLMLGCSMYILLIFISTIVASPGEFIRLMIHVLPIFYLNLALLFAHLCEKTGIEASFWVQKL